jgi:hypothetical protein
MLGDKLSSDKIRARHKTHLYYHTAKSAMYARQIIQKWTVRQWREIVEI